VADGLVLAAIASPRRREILRLIWDDEKQAGAIAGAMPDVTFGAVSLHLRALMEAGAVTVRTEGRSRYYRADRERLKHVSGALARMWDDALWRLKLHAELEETRRGPAPGHRRKKTRTKTRTS
jgi:DNA-binding transcriptional ArsR family regulator